jgi:hypothetical protein
MEFQLIILVFRKNCMQEWNPEKGQKARKAEKRKSCSCLQAVLAEAL